MTNSAWNAEYNNAKGALLVGDGSRPIVRTVGADGTALIADSAQADGVNWGFPSGVITNTQQPAFVARLSANANNATGNGTTWTWGSSGTVVEDLDQGGVFNGTTTFTAPVTGLYLLSVHVRCVNVSATITSGNLNIIAGGLTYTGIAATLTATSGQVLDLQNTVFAFLTATQTATAQLQLTGIGADTADVQGQASPVSTFSGVLLC